MFIGRVSEKHELKENLKTNNSNILPVIGRRGVGKTYLLTDLRLEIEHNLNIYHNHIVFNFEGKKGLSASKQVKNFINEINCKMRFYFHLTGDFIDKKINNWADCFSSLYNAIKDFFKDKEDIYKLIFFIDEFAWFHTKQSYFIQEFGSFWNKVKNELVFLNDKIFVKVFATSSAISWMNENLLKNNGSLYHKIDSPIYLKHFSLEETVKYLKQRDIVCSNLLYFKYYLITGGVARYLEKIDNKRTFEENAYRIFQSSSVSEFDSLFDRTFNSYKGIHKAIIELFYNKKWLTQKHIEKKLKFSSGAVSQALRDLTVSNLIVAKKNLENTETHYYLTDLFCLSYVKLIHGHLLTLDLFNNHAFDIKSGELFEVASQLNFDLIKKEIGRIGFKSTEQIYYGNNIQIDFLVQYENSLNFSICECKFYHDEYEITEDLQYKMIERKKVINHLIENKFKQNKKKSSSANIDFIVISFFNNFIKRPVHHFDKHCFNIQFDKIIDCFI